MYHQGWDHWDGDNDEVGVCMNQSRMYRFSEVRVNVNQLDISCARHFVEAYPDPCRFRCSEETRQ